jgi:hypothetical protein
MFHSRGENANVEAAHKEETQIPPPHPHKKKLIIFPTPRIHIFCPPE